MASKTWTCINLCYAFAGTADEGGVSSGDKPFRASGVGNLKDVALKKGLIESVQEEDVVSQVDDCTVGLECSRVVRVGESVDGRRGCRRDGESV